MPRVLPTGTPVRVLPKKLAKVANVNADPLWEGPAGTGPNGGITFSLLSRFLVCRERFRVHAVLGLRPADDFNHRLEFGSMWHVCEEAIASTHGADDWVPRLHEYAVTLYRKYPTRQEQVRHWYKVCKVQFSHYVAYWRKHPDIVKRTPLLSEQVFNVPYQLPSGRTVRLRGKWDSVDGVDDRKRKSESGVWLQENKSKGDVDEMKLKRQLGSGFDLQTMLYLVALTEKIKQATKGGVIL